MTVFKAIDIDMDAIDKRLEAQICYTTRQKKALQKLYALFRAGEWQACLDHIHKAFKYDRKEGYHEREHIVEEVGNVLHTVAHYNVYTSEQLLAQARDELQRIETVKVPKLANCARCGCDHRALVFHKLQRPLRGWTHWTPCPNNGQPILLEKVSYEAKSPKAATKRKTKR